MGILGDTVFSNACNYKSGITFVFDHNTLRLVMDHILLQQLLLSCFNHCPIVSPQYIYAV